MKTSNSIEINRPIHIVAELLENHDSYFKWDKNLDSYETFIGDPCQVGSKTRYIFKIGKKKKHTIEAVETIIYRNFPQENNLMYEIMGLQIMQKNFFEERGDSWTQWILEQECKLKGIARLFSGIFPYVIRKQTQKTMSRFKEFAEKNE